MASLVANVPEEVRVGDDFTVSAKIITDPNFDEERDIEGFVLAVNESYGLVNIPDYFYRRVKVENTYRWKFRAEKIGTALINIEVYYRNNWLKQVSFWMNIEE